MFLLLESPGMQDPEAPSDHSLLMVDKSESHDVHCVNGLLRPGAVVSVWEEVGEDVPVQEGDERRTDDVLLDERR